MSDHFSGPRAQAGPQCDICDYYAFVSPQSPGSLVLIMNLVPLAPPSSTFSESIVHRMRTRPATIDGATFVPADAELTVDVTFESADPTGSQKGSCTVAGQTIPLVTGDETTGQGKGVRVFAGRRSDPFFIDTKAFFGSLRSGRLAFTDPGVPGQLEGADVLGIVVELDSDVLAAAGLTGLVATVAETLVAGPLAVRLERVGRPEVKNYLLGMTDFDQLNRIELRDLYNLEDPFHLGPDYRDAYRSRLNANLAYLDSLDGHAGWSVDESGEHPLTDLLLDDRLILDLSRPFAETSFLEIELAARDGRPHTSCGGRWLNENVMDTLYTLTIGGPGSPTISDNLTQATHPATTSFPYLVRPNQAPAPAGPTPADASTADHEHHTFGHYQV